MTVYGTFLTIVKRTFIVFLLLSRVETSVKCQHENIIVENNVKRDMMQGNHTSSIKSSRLWQSVFALFVVW